MTIDAFYVMINIIALSYLINDLRTNKPTGNKRKWLMAGIVLFAILAAVNTYTMLTAPQ